LSAARLPLLWGSEVTVVTCTATNDGSVIPADPRPIGETIATDPDGPEHFGADRQTGATVELSSDGDPAWQATTIETGVMERGSKGHRTARESSIPLIGIDRRLGSDQLFPMHHIQALARVSGAD
jgi:hypothetical protein